MTKFFIVVASSFFVVLLAIILNSCVKDNCKRTYTYSYYVPAYKTTAEIKAGIKNGAVLEVINPGKLVLLGNYIFLNEIDNGIHVIDNRNPASPQNIAFINIPGNMDLALKGNTLYADLYTDLVTIDISNPLGVSVKKYNEGVFPYRAYGSGFYDDTTRIIARWIKRDTTITENCATERWVTFDSQVYYNYSSVASSSGNKNSVSPIGIGGSMARFAIVNNRMYTVSNSDLNVFNNIALVVAKDGLFQYDYSDVNNIHLVSKIGITRK
ncbi:MAG: hypothetical protein ABI208_00115 [Ginsengibacter sp.]